VQPAHVKNVVPGSLDTPLDSVYAMLARQAHIQMDMVQCRRAATAPPEITP